MPDPALENSDPSGAHVPWDSIGSSDGAFEELGPAEISDSDAAESSDSNADSTLYGTAALGSVPPGTEINPITQTAQPRVDVLQKQGGGWTFTILCAGLALIACCVLIPQADANRRVAYEREGLQRDLKNIEKQIDVNQEFLKKVADDPILAQRLAERQMKVIPQGTEVLDLAHDAGGMSPFQLVNVDPPAPLPAYRSQGGTLANLCYGAHTRLYLIGASLLMIAVGLVLR